MSADGRDDHMGKASEMTGINVVARCFALALAAAVAAPGAAVAQQTAEGDLSAGEIAARFERQKSRVEDGLGQARSLGSERGLRVVSEGVSFQDEEVAATPEGSSVPSGYVVFDEGDVVDVKIRFDFDSAALRDDQKPRLTTMCDVMRDADVDLFRVIGHTDSVGPTDYNERLSLLRAEEVRRYLVEQCGIDADRLQAVGVGEAFPLDPASPQADENRRVEFQALS